MHVCWKSLFRLASVALAFVCPTRPVGASAQAVAPRVGVVRATSDTAGALADAVDAALLRDLSAIAGIESPIVSPVDFAEVQLGVGCSDESRTCLLAIARAVRVDALVLRRLSVDAEGSGQLQLTYFQTASNDAPTTVETAASGPRIESELVAAVPALVRRLFGIAEIAAPAAAPAPGQRPVETVAPPDAAAAAAPAPQRELGISAATWISLGAGAAALTAGVVVGTIAEQDFSDWKTRPVESRKEADHARSAFDDIRTRAIAADILLAAGVVGIGIGAMLLVFDLDSEAELERSQARLAVGPVRGGAMLCVQGTLQDAL
jgi:hypothetical protein